MERVILVDYEDREIGTEEKLKAHKEAKLHRAFSIFILNHKGEMLLQQRSFKKYHCAGLWSNACCGHPQPGETLQKAVHRRLKEEMGFDCVLSEALQYTYKIKFDNGLYEHEYLHVFTGTSDGQPKPNQSEVMKYCWMPVEAMKRDVHEHPEKYSYWFKLSIAKLKI